MNRKDLEEIRAALAGAKEALGNAGNLGTALEIADEALKRGPGLRFPVSLRRMWSGREIQQWLDHQFPLREDETPRPCNEVPPGNGYCDMCAAGKYDQCRYVVRRTHAQQS